MKTVLLSDSELVKRFVTVTLALSLFVTWVSTNEMPFGKDLSSAVLFKVPAYIPGVGNSVGKSGLCSSCTFTLDADAGNIDGLKLRLKPGDVICLQGGVKYRPLRFINIEGTENNPIIITTCNGNTEVEGVDHNYSIKVLQSHHFRITGGESQYGILLTGGQIGLTLDNLTTNFEVDHLEVTGVGFAGIMAKTDPTCDDSTTRGHFVMRNVLIHDNFVHSTGGEGIYVGNSFYSGGVKKPCGIRWPHDIKDIRIYNNLVESTGWDGIQLGSAVQDAAVYNNTVRFYGKAGKASQDSGIQIGEGTGGLCFNNLIQDGAGNGIAVLGLGDNLVSGNVIIAAGAAGIFCDDRYTAGTAFRFMDNIIISSGQQGIRLYSIKVKSIVKNNLIVNPGVSHKGSGVPLNTDYIFKQSKDVRVIESNNVFVPSISEVSSVYNAALRYDAIHQSSPDSLNLKRSHPRPLKIQDLLLGKKVPLDF